jgi:hypothetical protein
MFRREVLNKIGLWDTVRVGADNEFIGRIKAHYGKESYHLAYENYPLAFGLDDENTLTRSRATHVSSVYHGLRHIYRQIWAFRHSTGHEEGLVDIKMPARMVRHTSAPITLDVLFIADFSDCLLIDKLIENVSLPLADSVIGLLHWPNFYKTPSRFCITYFNLLSSYRAISIVPGDEVEAKEVILVSHHVLFNQIDNVPSIKIEDEVLVYDGEERLVKLNERSLALQIRQEDEG